MKCKGSPEKVSLFIDGMLDPPDQKAMAAHLEECPACKEIKDDYVHISGMLKQAYAREDMSGMDVRFNVMARLYGGKRTWRRSALAASMVLLLAGGFFVGSVTGRATIISKAEMLRDVMERDDLRKTGYYESNVENVRVRYEEIGF